MRFSQASLEAALDQPGLERLASKLAVFYLNADVLKDEFADSSARLSIQMSCPTCSTKENSFCPSISISCSRFARSHKVFIQIRMTYETGQSYGPTKEGLVNWAAAVQSERPASWCPSAACFRATATSFFLVVLHVSRPDARTSQIAQSMTPRKHFARTSRNDRA